MNLDKFYQCTKDFLFVKKGDVIVRSHFWWYRTIILATPTSETRIVGDVALLKMGYLNDEDHFRRMTIADLKSLKPHFHKKLRVDYNILFRNTYLLSLPDYCCRSCGQKLEDEFYFDSSIKKLNEDKGFIANCYMCKSKKVLLFDKNVFLLDIFNLKLFDII